MIDPKQLEENIAGCLSGLALANNVAISSLVAIIDKHPLLDLPQNHDLLPSKLLIPVVEQLALEQIECDLQGAQQTYQKTLQGLAELLRDNPA